MSASGAPTPAPLANVLSELLPRERERLAFTPITPKKQLVAEAKKIARQQGARCQPIASRPATQRELRAGGSPGSWRRSSAGSSVL